MTLKLCKLIEYLIGKILWKNYAENEHQKPVPDLVLILICNPREPLKRNSFTIEPEKVNFIFSF